MIDRPPAGRISAGPARAGLPAGLPRWPHARAGLELGEELLAELGDTVLVPSRPGYGQDPLRTGRSPAEFVDAAAELS
jgi:hypothetical protein